MKRFTFTREFILYNAPILVSAFLIIALLLIPTGFEDAIIFKEAYQSTAKVLAVDNSDIVVSGIISSGEQSCQLEILSGPFKGRITKGVNNLSGSLEQDKFFVIGDKALVYINQKDGEITAVSMIDHYRLNYAVILAGLFAIGLVVFAGKTGARAILSFALSILLIWKLLIPLYLRGYQPIIIGIFVVMILTFVIISLVFGFNEKFYAAFMGVSSGLLLTCILGIIFTNLFKIHGSVMVNSESLLYAGFQHLNLTQIFMASIFIGASGAVTDLAVDITAAMNEVLEKKPDISRKELIKSGMVVGSANMGTMTTTLLLAYSGGYISLLMVFMAQGTPVSNILNYKYVSAEIVETIVGSFGLLTVAPLTAVICGFLFVEHHPHKSDD
ncbi:YibE/F-like protein [Oxobacter pfennigii]|uniref:YibE/F-like protein n=1 Tax=Oxobacter pfennigii TaxID=36849 RepID=A0A0P8YFF3_9CLOT|nr:YibE/F family protein [Oxobacter pfennigii]KPU45830.1 YibE/F-like protein [Oxobacter pfennigii]